MSKVKYLVVENEETGNWEIWVDDEDDIKVVMMAEVFDEDFAYEVVDLLNSGVEPIEEEEDDEDDSDDDDYGEAVDEFIKRNENTYTNWDEDK